MSRLQRRVSFAASMVTIVACGDGSGGDEVRVDGPPPDDCQICNPPVDMGESLVCTAHATAGCAECLVSPPWRTDRSPCAQAVCDLDPACCETAWDERCVERVDAICPEARCVDAVTVAGSSALVYASWGPAGVEARPPVVLDEPMSVAWAGPRAVVAGPCAPRLIQADWLADAPVVDVDGLPALAACADEPGWFGGRRVRWADLDGDGRLDVIAAGRGGVVWFPATEAGFADALTIAPPEDGEVRDVAVHDVDGDLALDVVAAGDVATRVYLQDGAAWTPAAWTGPAASTAETCTLVPGAARELVLVTAAGVVAYAFEAGSIAAAPLLSVDGAFAGADCGDVDGLDVLDELVVSSVDGPIVVLDGDGAELWSSATAIDPPLTFPGAGVDTGDLDGDGDVDVVVAERGAGAPVHVLRRDATAPGAFTHDAADELAGDQHGQVELARLRPGP